MCFGTGSGGVEITESEYNVLIDKYQRIQAAVDSVYNNIISIDEVDEDIRINVKHEVVLKFAEQVYIGAFIETVPESLRADVQIAVDTLITERGEYIPEPTESELAVDEALAILRGEESE